VPSFQSEWAPGLLVAGCVCVCVAVVLCVLFSVSVRVCPCGCMCDCLSVFLPGDECKANLTQPDRQYH